MIPAPVPALTQEQRHELGALKAAHSYARDLVAKFPGSPAAAKLLADCGDGLRRFWQEASR